MLDKIKKISKIKIVCSFFNYFIHHINNLIKQLNFIIVIPHRNHSAL